MKEENEGERIASFPCKASNTGDAVSKVFPSLLALLGVIGSQIAGNPNLLLLLVLGAASVSVLIPLLLMRRGRDARCIIKEKGIRIEPVNAGNEKAFFVKWDEISRFESSNESHGGGVLTFYPDKFPGFLRKIRIRIEDMSDYLQLYNYASSRVGMFGSTSR